MATFTFQKPDKVIMIDSTDFEGKFEFRPLEPGYGLTVGNALRRVLLASLEGFAFTSVKIDNVDHEFTSLPGIVEDVTEIILNLKQVRLKRQIDSVDNETVTVSVNTQDQLKAGDLQKFIWRRAGGGNDAGCDAAYRDVDGGAAGRLAVWQACNVPGRVSGLSSGLRLVCAACPNFQDERPLI